MTHNRTCEAHASGPALDGPLGTLTIYGIAPSRLRQPIARNTKIWFLGTMALNAVGGPGRPKPCYRPQGRAGSAKSSRCRTTPVWQLYHHWWYRKPTTIRLSGWR